MNLAINVNKGHICVDKKALAVYLYKVYGNVKLTAKALSDVKNGLGLPSLLTYNTKTHKERTKLANAINLCAAEYMGKTGKQMSTNAGAYNWNFK